MCQSGDVSNHFTEDGSARHEYCNHRDRSGKERLSAARGELPRQSRTTPSDPPRPDTWAVCELTAMPHWHGSLCECALLGANAAELWAHRAPHRTTLCEALCEDAQDRCDRCRGDLRSGEPPKHAFCADKEHRAAVSIFIAHT